MQICLADALPMEYLSSPESYDFISHLHRVSALLMNPDKCERKQSHEETADPFFSLQSGIVTVYPAPSEILMLVMAIINDFIDSQPLSRMTENTVIDHGHGQEHDTYQQFCAYA